MGRSGINNTHLGVMTPLATLNRRCKAPSMQCVESISETPLQWTAARGSRTDMALITPRRNGAQSAAAGGNGASRDRAPPSPSRWRPPRPPPPRSDPSSPGRESTGSPRPPATRKVARCVSRATQKFRHADTRNAQCRKAAYSRQMMRKKDGSMESQSCLRFQCRTPTTTRNKMVRHGAMTRSHRGRPGAARTRPPGHQAQSWGQLLQLMQDWIEVGFVEARWQLADCGFSLLLFPPPRPASEVNDGVTQVSSTLAVFCLSAVEAP